MADEVLDLTSVDFNGDLCVPNQQGEFLQEVRSNVVVFPAKEDAVQTEPPFKRVLYEQAGGDAARTNDLCRAFLRNQLSYIDDLTQEKTSPDGRKIPPLLQATPDEIVLLAYLRSCVYRLGLYKPLDDPRLHNCKYADFDTVPATLPVNPRKEVITAFKGMRAKLDVLGARATDIICLVAYFFRARGHHYMDDFEVRYRDVWNNCLPSQDMPQIPWRLVATVGLHAIYPDDLDNFWLDQTAKGNVCGALTKRVTTAPAGMAIWHIMARAAQELNTVLPLLTERNPEAVEALMEVSAKINENRWYGSVNASLYGAQVCTVAESNLSALAAVVVAILSTAATDSPLLRSKALQRVANNAPIVGVAMGVTIKAALKSRGAVEQVIPQPKQAQAPLED